MEKTLEISIPLIYVEEHQEDELGNPTHIAPPSLTVNIDPGHSLVFVGANGAGKTRLGVHIEQQLFQKSIPVQRIAAQRSNAFSDNVSLNKTDIAYSYLRIGNANLERRHKDQIRWGRKPATHPLNDYDAVLQALYAEQSEAAVKENQARATNPDIQRVITKLEQLSHIWERVLPRRKLEISHADIKVAAVDNIRHPYPASELSDGERVIFYLIGQALLAESASALIIDEPELHIHKAILSTLWDEIEKARQDIIFIYITHDLEFATSRGATQIFAVEEFDYSRSRWKITESTDNVDLPEPILLKILGSRKNILFTEGENGKDAQIFRLLYPDETIVERGSCGNVISTVAAFKSNATLHHKSCKGIIDRDGRSEEQCEHLSARGIIILPISEIENLLLLPSIWEEILKNRTFIGDELAEKIEATKSKIIEIAQNDLAGYSVRSTKRTLDEMMKKIGLQNRNDIAALSQEWDDEIQQINLENIAADKTAMLQGFIDNGEVEKILLHYDNKGMLVTCVGDIFKQNYNAFFDETIRVLKTSEGAAIIEKMRAAIPNTD